MFTFLLLASGEYPAMMTCRIYLFSSKKMLTQHVRTSSRKACARCVIRASWVCHHKVLISCISWKCSIERNKSDYKQYFNILCNSKSSHLENQMHTRQGVQSTPFCSPNGHNVTIKDLLLYLFSQVSVSEHSWYNSCLCTVNVWEIELK